MSLDTVIRGAGAGLGADVDASGRLLVIPSGGTVALVNGDGDPVRTVAEGRLDVARDHLLWIDNVDDTAVDSRKMAQTTTTMTITVSSGQYVLNGGAVNTLSTEAILTSQQRFQYQHESAIYAHALVLPVNLPATNARAQLGFFLSAARASPTDGAFFRWDLDGTFKCVTSFGGVETTSVGLTPPSTAFAHHMEIELSEEECVFEIDGVEVYVAKVLALGLQAPLTSNSYLPFCAQLYTAASAPTLAPQLKLAGCAVTQQLLEQGKPWPLIMAMMGHGAHQAPLTPYAQTANHANSTSPAAATLSNTAAGYAKLGGRFKFVAPAGAETDFALFAIQVPVGRKLIVTSISISAMNTGAAVAATATILDWFAALDGTALSLATTDAYGTNVIAPRRIPLGLQGFEVGAGIGKSAPDIVRDFMGAPLVCQSGRYFIVGVQVPVGTATVSQEIRGTVTVNGFYD